MAPLLRASRVRSEKRPLMHCIWADDWFPATPRPDLGGHGPSHWFPNPKLSFSGCLFMALAVVLRFRRVSGRLSASHDVSRNCGQTVWSGLRSCALIAIGHHIGRRCIFPRSVRIRKSGGWRTGTSVYPFLSPGSPTENQPRAGSPRLEPTMGVSLDRNPVEPSNPQSFRPRILGPIRRPKIVWYLVPPHPLMYVFRLEITGVRGRTVRSDVYCYRTLPPSSAANTIERPWATLAPGGSRRLAPG